MWSWSVFKLCEGSTHVRCFLTAMLFKSVKLISEGRTSMILSHCCLDNVADTVSCSSLHFWEICYCLYPLNWSLKEAPRWSSYSEILQSTTTLSAGDNDQLPIQRIQYHGTNCLELSVSSYIRKVPLSLPLSRHIVMKTELFSAAYDTV